MQDIDITTHYLKIGNVKYFRGKAENVVLACYGQKKDPVGANAYLAVEDRVRPSLLENRVRQVGRQEISWNRQRAADVEANGKLRVFGVDVKVAATMSFEDARSGNLELVKFVIDEGKLKDLLNENATKARTYLEAEGKDARIVSEVWVVVTAELSRHYRNVASVSVSADAGEGALEVTTSSTSGGSHTVRLDPGSTFAYLMHKVTRWNDDRTQILDLEDDRKGMG